MQKFAKLVQLEICGTNFFVSRIPFVPSRKFSNSPESRLSRPEFFRIVPISFVPSRKNFGTVPFVPRDGTNGIFRDSGLSCRTLFGTLVFLYCPESRLSRPGFFRIVPVPGVARDGTNVIFRDSGLSRRTLLWTHQFQPIPETSSQK